MKTIITQRGLPSLTSLGTRVPARADPKNEGGKLPESWVKNTFSAENERGEGITGRERGVRYWNVRVLGGRPSPFGPKTAEKWKTAENVGGSVVRRDANRRNFGGFEIGVAELRSRRFLDRLNGTGVNLILKSTTTVENHQKLLLFL